MVAAAAAAAAGGSWQHDLGGLLGMPRRDLAGPRAPSGREFGERAAGLAVDRLFGTCEVVIKPLDAPLSACAAPAVTVMGDGRTVLLEDLAALI